MGTKLKISSGKCGGIGEKVGRGRKCKM